MLETDTERATRMEREATLHKETLEEARKVIRLEIQKYLVKLCDLDSKFDLDIELQFFDAALEMYEAQLMAHMRWALAGTKVLYGLRPDKEACEARRALDVAAKRFEARTP